MQLLQRHIEQSQHPHPAIQLLQSTNAANPSLVRVTRRPAAQRTATGSCQNTSQRQAQSGPEETTSQAVVAASTRRPPLARLKAARARPRRRDGHRPDPVVAHRAREGRSGARCRRQPRTRQSRPAKAQAAAAASPKPTVVGEPGSRHTKSHPHFPRRPGMFWPWDQVRAACSATASTAKPPRAAVRPDTQSTRAHQHRYRREPISVVSATRDGQQDQVRECLPIANPRHYGASSKADSVLWHKSLQAYKAKIVHLSY